MTETPEPRRRRRPALRLLAVGTLLLAIALAAAWLNRKALVREALTGWLRGRGIPSATEVKAFGPTHFRARLRIGPANHPDFTAEDAEVGYRLTVHGIEVTSVRLDRPVLRAAFHDGRFSVGSLDPIVREFLKRPPRPQAPQPRITVQNGRLFLASDYGPLVVTADALVDNGKLQRLTAVSAPARLRGPTFAVDLGQSALNVLNRNDRIDVRFDAPLTTARAGEASAARAQLHLALAIPYPDRAKLRGEAPVTARARLSGGQLEFGDRRLERATVSATFQGKARGGIEDLALAGRVDAGLSAKAAEGFAARSGPLEASATVQDVRWSRKGGDRISGDVALSGQAEHLAAADVAFSTFTLAAQGPLAASAGGVSGALAVKGQGRGSWTGLGPPAAADAPGLAALKRAARDFRAEAADIRLTLADGSAALALPRPLRISADNGAHATLAGRGNVPLFGVRGKGFRLTAGGGGLPSVEADIAKFELVQGGLTAAGHVTAADLSLGPLRGGRIDAAGSARLADGRVTVETSRCSAFAADRLEFGANDVRAVSGRFCSAGAPVATFAGGAWRIVGRAEQVAAAVPFLQARISGAAGRVTASGRGARSSADIAVETAKLEDTAPSGRFRPLLAAGEARLQGDVWRADFDVRLPQGPHIAHAHLVHDSLTGGGVGIDTGELRFAEGGLQPIDVSPLAGAIGSPATGAVRFHGGFEWNAQGAASSGRVEIADLDFRSPAGPVEGLSGSLVLTSLAPLQAAAGQELHADKLDAIVPVTDITARFGLAGEALNVEGGEATVGGGKVRVERLDVPFAPGAPIEGVLLLEGVQLHDLVEASPFGDRVDLDARVSGRLPFALQDSHVQITGGQLKAIAPGRLSIDRTAITGVQAAGAMAAPGVTEPVSPNDTFTDFAYQAMEHLAFDSLDASIATRDDGRLGALFHIIGKFDPPKPQELRLPLLDLIQRKFLGRKLPLPSGTGVNLTLDTSLNLDDLLADYADYQRLRGSATVQP